MRRVCIQASFMSITRRYHAAKIACQGRLVGVINVIHVPTSIFSTQYSTSQIMKFAYHVVGGTSAIKPLGYGPQIEGGSIH